MTYYQEQLDIIEKAQKQGIPEGEIKKYLIQEFDIYAKKTNVIITFVYCDRRENVERSRVGKSAGWRVATQAFNLIPENKRPQIRSANTTATRYWDRGRSAWRAFRKDCFIVISSFQNTKTKKFEDTPEGAGLKRNKRNVNHLFKYKDRRDTPEEKAKQMRVSKREEEKKSRELKKSNEMSILSGATQFFKNLFGISKPKGDEKDEFKKSVEDSFQLIEKAFNEGVVDAEVYLKALEAKETALYEVELKQYANALVRNEDGELLFIKRSNMDTLCPGEWALPGGKIEMDEDPKAAALRELKEETNLDGLDAILLGKVVTENAVCYYYEVEVENINIIVLDEENDNYQFMSDGEWLGIDLLLDLKEHLLDLLTSGIKKALDSIQKRKFDRVMREFADGKLKTSAGEKVTDRKQAIAIAYSETNDLEKSMDKNLIKTSCKISIIKIKDYELKIEPQGGEFALNLYDELGLVSKLSTSDTEKVLEEQLEAYEKFPHLIELKMKQLSEPSISVSILEKAGKNELNKKGKYKNNPLYHYDKLAKRWKNIEETNPHEIAEKTPNVGEVEEKQNNDAIKQLEWDKEVKAHEERQEEEKKKKTKGEQFYQDNKLYIHKAVDNLKQKGIVDLQDFRRQMGIEIKRISQGKIYLADFPAKRLESMWHHFHSSYKK